MRIRFLALLVGCLLPSVGLAGSDAPDYTGHYELAGKSHDRIFTIDLRQTGSRIQMHFSGSIPAIPDAGTKGTGTGSVDSDGIMKLKFKDIAGNEGTAITQPTKEGFTIDMRLSKMANPASVHFYSLLDMKKTKSTP